MVASIKIRSHTMRVAMHDADGYRVLRFWNNQIFEETTAVLETIMGELLAASPHPDLLLRYKCALAPQAGEGTQ